MLNQKNRLVNILNNKTSFSPKKIIIPKTNEILSYLNILYREGIILSFVVQETSILITVNNRSGLLTDNKIYLLSKKRFKNNKKYIDLIKYSGTLQTLYLSTSKGILSIKDSKALRLGGYPFILI